MIKRAADLSYKTGRRVVIAIVGTSVLLLGVVMIVTPGPALIVIPAGLAILSIEFAWARNWLRKLREGISRKSAKDFGDRAEAHRSEENRAARAEKK